MPNAQLPLVHCSLHLRHAPTVLPLAGCSKLRPKSQFRQYTWRVSHRTGHWPRLHALAKTAGGTSNTNKSLRRHQKGTGKPTPLSFTHCQRAGFSRLFPCPTRFLRSPFCAGYPSGSCGWTGAMRSRPGEPTSRGKLLTTTKRMRQNTTQLSQALSTCRQSHNAAGFTRARNLAPGLTVTPKAWLKRESRAGLSLRTSSHHSPMLGRRHRSFPPFTVRNFLSWYWQNYTKAPSTTSQPEAREVRQMPATHYPAGGQGMSVAKLIFHQSCKPGTLLSVAPVSCAGSQN